MLATLIVATAALAAGTDEGTTSIPPSAELKAYEAAKATVGRDSASQVRLALWCEMHGLTAEKVKHLALAVLRNPSDSTARGLLGLVAYRGKWQHPEEIGKAIKDDEGMAGALAEYNARRGTVKNTAEAHWQMALWCEQKGLKPEAIAHLTTVVRLDPHRAAAWKRLGYKQHGGRWATDQQLATEKAEKEAQRQAEKHWRSTLLKWREALAHPRQKADAERALSLVDDPRAVPVVWAVFMKGTLAQQLTGVQILGQIDAPGSSRALALLAISSNLDQVRQRATETLRRRDPRDYAGILIGLLRDPVKYEVRKVDGPGSTGVLFVEGKQFNLQRRYSPPPVPNVPMFLGDSLSYDNDGLPVILRPAGSAWFRLNLQQVYGGMDNQIRMGQQMIDQAAHGQGGPYFKPVGEFLVAGATAEKHKVQNMMANAMPGSRLEQQVVSTEVIPVGQIMRAAQESAILAQRQLDSDVQSLDAQNREIQQANTRVLDVLTPLSGQDYGTDRKAWESWFTDLRGYASISTSDEQSNPTYVENVPLATVAAPLPSFIQTPGAIRTAHSCFGRGTLVRLLDGPAPIETVRVGDRALVQNTTTGALEFEPVVAVFHNRPNQTLKISLGDEKIVVTGIHRFWKAGKGWTMARDLKVGDLVRSLSGTCRVESVEDDDVQPVFNLEVASGQSFFVGTRGMLVHDNSLVEPVLRPFDRPAELAQSSQPQP